MRVAQYKILTNILEKIRVPAYIHAFEKRRNIPLMAAQHVGKKVVVSFDLKDFFTSIKQNHVEQIFKHIGFLDQPARTLSELCTYKSFVPQGALTSPKLSNIVTALTFGPLVKAYCDEKGYTLSIYADDITISSDQDLDGQEGRDTIKTLLSQIREFVSGYGFRINGEKTKLMKHHQRQYVCGAVVNSKVNLQKTERHRLRAIVHNCEKNGIIPEATKSNLPPDKFYSKTMGLLNWFAQLNPQAGNRVKDKFKNLAYEDPIMCPIATAEDVKAVEPSGSQPPMELPWEDNVAKVEDKINEGGITLA